MTHKHDMRSQFESDYQARITTSKHAYRLRKNYSYLSSYMDMGIHDAQILEERIPVMQVEITEPDLDVMIKQLKDANWHAQVQNKYPHLRAAYMEYLTHVHMTVDPDLC